ncbi:MAG: GNAT family N-acetyltransferase [Saprospiraceae bacterium]|nr:GNAT family N-acetyltransferase [Saprospiraceae bacterium]
MVIKVNSAIHLDLINDTHALPIFNLVQQNRLYLKSWLSFVDKMDSLTFAENFVKGTMKRNQEGVEYAFVIVEKEIIVGRIGVYKIDLQNKIGEIGYWLAQDAQGKGIMNAACLSLIHYCFANLLLNRVEIKCATENHKSQSIPINLGFTQEGVIRQGEYLHDRYHDLYLYSLLKSEFDG